MSHDRAFPTHLLDVKQQPSQVDSEAAHTPAPGVQAAFHLRPALRALPAGRGARVTGDGTLVSVALRQAQRGAARRRGPALFVVALDGRRVGRRRVDGRVPGLTAVLWRRHGLPLCGGTAAGWGRAARRDAHGTRRLRATRLAGALRCAGYGGVVPTPVRLCGSRR